MYNVNERAELLRKIIAYISDNNAFEGLMQIGSCSVGFADIYSDIDLMAGCFNDMDIDKVNSELQIFFATLGASYIEKRAWTKTALGLSVYFENGLSVDISFMPTKELPIRSPLYKIVLAKTEHFTNTVNEASGKMHLNRYGVNDSIHYRFINELRYAEIAILRDEFIFADIALNNARQLLLSVQTVCEGKKLHQFKAFNTLNCNFLDKLNTTYPKDRNFKDIQTAKEAMLSLYLEVVEKSDFLSFDNRLLTLLGCFE